MVEHQPGPGEQLSKAETIERLRETIGQLEEIVNQLSARPESELPPSITALVESTEKLVASLETVTEPPAPPTIEQSDPAIASEALEEAVSDTPPPNEVAPSATVAEPPPPAPSQPLTDRALPNPERLDGWDQFLSKVRTLLPSALSQKLSYWGLTGILAGSVIAILLSSVLLFSNKRPTGDEAPAADIATPPTLEAPAAEQPIETFPSPEPQLQLTPEQGLIAAIQAQVDQITSQYAQGLIQTIEANFADSRLIVKVGSDWYTLEDTRQDQLANEMLRRSQELDFRKLEIIDLQNTLLARSPVVGDEMVILNRGE